MLSFFVWLSDTHNTSNICIFTGYLRKYEQEYKANKEIGYSYVFKDAVYNKEKAKIKANCDVDIAIDGTMDGIENNLEKAILITSDGDFLSLIRFWQSRNIQVKLLSPADAEKCSYLLKKINIPTTFLNQVMKKFTNEKALDEDETS